MKKILNLISSLLIIVLLSGCGMFNLNNFVMPDDLEFLAVVESLDTPKRISNYMAVNFNYKTHDIYAPSPYILWKIKEGDCNDFSTFGTFVANHHGYETWQINISYGSIYTHCIGVYNEGKYSLTDNKKYYYGFNTFRETVNESSKYIGKLWKSYIVYDYNMNIIEKGINE